MTDRRVFGIINTHSPNRPYRNEEMKIAIASDHGGFATKTAIVAAVSGEFEILDMGPATADACDYPDYAIPVAKAVASGEADFGVLVCRSGVGMSMTANRFQNVRAVICATADQAVLTRRHNDANVLCIGADSTSDVQAVSIIRAFLSTAADDDARHVRRRWKLERAQRLSDCSGLMRDDPEVFAAIEAQTRQEDAEINLIASENTSSRACREAAGSVLMNPATRAINAVSYAQLVGALRGYLPLGQSLLLIWPHLVGLLALTFAAFAISAVGFMRQEIRGT